MTLFEVEELVGYWTDHPPLHLLIAAYLGMKRAKPRASPKPKVASAHGADGRAAQLLADLGPAFVNGDVHAGLGSVLLDVAELRRKMAVADRGPRTGHWIVET